MEMEIQTIINFLIHDPINLNILLANQIFIILIYLLLQTNVSVNQTFFLKKKL